MPYIKVNTNKIAAYSNDINSVYARVNRIKSEFASIGYSLDWDIKSAAGINNRIKTIENEMISEHLGLKRMQSFLNSTVSKYNNAEKEIGKKYSLYCRAFQSCLRTIPGCPAPKITREEILEKFKNSFGNAIAKKATDVKSKTVGAIKKLCNNTTQTIFDVAQGIHAAYESVNGVIKTTINYFSENYNNKGWVYKTVQYGKATLKSAGGVAKIATGVASIFASGGLSTPAAVLTCVSGINDLINCGYDFAAISDNAYEKVGNFNMLKDGLAWTGGKIGNFFGNETVGSNIGKGLYYGSELYVGIANLRNAWDKVKQIDKTDISKLGQEIKKLGNTEIDVWKVLNTDISQLKLSYKLATYEYKTVADASKNLKTATACLSKFANVIKKANKTYSVATGTENWLGKFFESYDNATEYKKYTYGGIKSTIESISKNYKILYGY